MIKLLYVLRGRLAVPASSVEEWGRMMQDPARTVAVEEIAGYTISTVFIGVDHRLRRGLPLLFETMIFDHAGNSTDYQERCGTWEEAIDMHEAAVASICAEITP